MGVIYYKLADPLYKGDSTKGCGLLGTEIDANFNFLRGYDIEKFEINEDKNKLTLTRVNGEELTVDIERVLPEEEKYGFSFDSEEGKLTIVFPDGEEQVLSGFAVEGQDFKVATDGTIEGNGLKKQPLTLNRTLITGTYGPVDKLIDLTDGSNLEDGDTNGRRYLTKEKVDIFGCLYSYDEIVAINDYLADNGNGWRVPTREDWAKMLNSIECEEDRNHQETISGPLGKRAGKLLKSSNLWQSVNDADYGDEELTPEGEDAFGFCIYPVGAYETGEHELNGLRKATNLWSITQNENEEVYTRDFTFRHADVLQKCVHKAVRLPLRLVKDGEYDFHEYETINGSVVPCVLMKDSNTIWTKVNVYFKGDFGGIRPEEWDNFGADAGIKTVYFVNEWDGKRWHKRQMLEGDSVVILDAETGDETENYREWRLVNGELVDVVSLEINAVKAEIGDELNNLNTKIDELSAATVNIENNLNTLTETEERHYKENTVKNEDGSVKVVRDGENGTILSVAFDNENENIKNGGNGLYFDGDFGTF